MISYAPTQASRISHDRPVLVVKPVFLGLPTVAAIIPIWLFMTVWAGGFCGGFSMLGLQFLSRLTGLQLPPGATFIFFGALAFFGIPLVTYVGKRNGYAKTEYRFFADRLEYYEGFFRVDQKVVLYRDVLEVEMTKGPIQRQYGLGTVLLMTASAAYMRPNSTRSGGIRVTDIENPEEVYENVKKLVRDAKDRVRT